MELARELFKAWGYRRIDEVCAAVADLVIVFDASHCRSSGLKSDSWED